MPPGPLGGRSFGSRTASDCARAAFFTGPGCAAACAAAGVGRQRLVGTRARAAVQAPGRWLPGRRPGAPPGALVPAAGHRRAAAAFAGCAPRCGTTSCFGDGGLAAARQAGPAGRLLARCAPAGCQSGYPAYLDAAQPGRLRARPRKAGRHTPARHPAPGICRPAQKQARPSAPPQTKPAHQAKQAKNASSYLASGPPKRRF